MVVITPKCTRAKNRVREHGADMKLVREGSFQGRPAILVESLGNTWRGEKWLGWFTSDEVDHSRCSRL